MMRVENLTVHYGGIKAVNGISIHVPAGKIVTLIGSNGAGKSTTLNAISKVIPMKSGVIQYCGEDVTHLGYREMVQKGVVQIPEGRHVFPDMTVMENLKIGAFLRNDSKVQADIEHMHELFPRLLERSNQLAGTLSGGEQQMLAVARGLMAKPSLLMMDEPSLGLAPLIVKNIFSIITRLNQEIGLTVLLIEQNAHAALRIADYGYVLETGTVGLEGPGSKLIENTKVREMYLGK